MGISKDEKVLADKDLEKVTGGDVQSANTEGYPGKRPVWEKDQPQPVGGFRLRPKASEEN